MDNSENFEDTADIHHELTSSDEYHEFQCSTCDKEGKNVSADMYCVECDDFLCPTCLKQHNKFGSLKGHQITRTSSNTGNVDKGKDNCSLDLPSQRCQLHHGKLLDMFCKNHNEVCCGVCTTINHSSCSGMVYLPNMAFSEAEVMKETKNILIEIEKVKDQAKHRSSQTRHLSANLTAKKSNLSGKIRENSDKIINHFKTLEKNILSELDEKVAEAEEDLKSDLKGSDEVIAVLQEENRILTKHIAGDNISSLFVQLKLAEKLRQKCVDTLKHTKTSADVNIELLDNNLATDVVNNMKSLGSIVKNKTIKTVKFNGDYDIKSRDDKNICDITDIIQHDEDTLFVSDFENRSLKKLDNQYRVIDCLPLPGKPSALCFVSTSSLAIALTDTKHVQFANLTGKMTITSSFSVRDSCRGIAHVNGNIYVTCGGIHKYKEGKGMLCVYSLLGKMRYVIDIDLTVPKHIQKRRDYIYIADGHSLIIMANSGRGKQRRTFKDIINLKGICTGPGNQYFICGYNSSNIVLLSENVYPMCTLDVDGIEKPQALWFDRQRSRLIVAMDTSNIIKVFDITFK